MQSLSPTAPPKKLLPILMLEVLRRFTDEDHHVSQRELQQLLYREYQMEADRKTIHRNIAYLLEAGYPIEFSETSRKTAGSKDQASAMISDLWFCHEFDDSELRLLIDGVLFSTHIPTSQRMKLVDKLEALSSRYFESHIAHISAAPDAGIVNSQSQNRELF